MCPLQAITLMLFCCKGRIAISKRHMSANLRKGTIPRPVWSIDVTTWFRRMPRRRTQLALVPNPYKIPGTLCISCVSILKSFIICFIPIILTSHGTLTMALDLLYLRMSYNVLLVLSLPLNLRGRFMKTFDSSCLKRTGCRWILFRHIMTPMKLQCFFDHQLPHSLPLILPSVFFFLSLLFAVLPAQTSGKRVTPRLLLPSFNIFNACQLPASLI